MGILNEQLHFDDVLNVVKAFYNRARGDAQIGHFFVHIKDFSGHEIRIASFWWLALGGKTAELPGKPPAFDMINKHIALGIEQIDLDRWLHLFDRTLFGELDMAVASAWQVRAHEIASQLKRLAIERQPVGLVINEP